MYSFMIIVAFNLLVLLLMTYINLSSIFIHAILSVISLIWGIVALIFDKGNISISGVVLLIVGFTNIVLLFVCINQIGAAF